MADPAPHRPVGPPHHVRARGSRPTRRRDPRRVGVHRTGGEPHRGRDAPPHRRACPAGADLGPLLEKVTQDSKGYLDPLRDTAERRTELDELVLSFTDPLFIAGSIEDAYDYLYRADLWPERIPHVAALAMTEDV